MHRSPALTYFEVADTAQELLLQGINPTQEALKTALKRGSNTTIVKHLQRWRAEQGSSTQVAVKENLPPEVIAAVQTVWHTLIEKADYQVQQVQTNANEKIDELENVIDSTQHDLKTLQQNFTELKTAHELLLKEKRVAEQTIQQQQADLIESNAKLNAQADQNLEKQKRINELYRLHQQAQTNLENSHENAREQRLFDQQRHEQIQAELELTIKSLRSELATAQQNTMLIKVEYEKANSSLLKQQQDNGELLNQREQFKNNQAGYDNKISQLEYIHNQLENTVSELNKKVDQQSFSNHEAQKQLAVLSQQLLDAKEININLEKANQKIAEEKWSLMQEKIGLLAQLQFFDQNMNAELPKV